MSIVAPYAAVLGLLFAVLGIRTIRLRTRLRIAMGDGGNPQLLRAMRVNANFAEYVPLTLFLVYLTEQGGAPPGMVHFPCACLLAGRVLHALGVSRIKEPFALRVIAMVLTFGPLVGASTLLLRQYVAHLN